MFYDIGSLCLVLLVGINGTEINCEWQIIMVYGQVSYNELTAKHKLPSIGLAVASSKTIYVSMTRLDYIDGNGNDIFRHEICHAWLLEQFILDRNHTKTVAKICNVPHFAPNPWHFHP